MAYSNDLRSRIVKAVNERGVSIPEAAKTFEVGSATVERYLRRYRESGDLQAHTPPGRPSGLTEHEELLRQQFAQKSDLQLEDRCKQ
jgi:transposase